MPGSYNPPSKFLQRLIARREPVSESASAGADLQRLIALTTDKSVANRDWAVFLLAQEDCNNPALIPALLKAADDRNEFIRSEAILGLARRNRKLALPLIKRELEGSSASVPLFEAAAIVADPALLDDLRAYSEPSGDAFVDNVVSLAIRACQSMRSQQT